jgi:hypothetical protein
MPDLVKVAAEYKDKGLDVLLVSYDLQIGKPDPIKTRERVERFVNDRKWGFDVAILPAAQIEALQTRYELPAAIPATLAFDRQGRVVQLLDGEGDAAAFRELAQAALRN